MTYRIFVEAEALREIDAFVSWLAPLSAHAADRHEKAISTIVNHELARHPKLFSYFWLTGKPYRARLYTVSRRTKFWLVYRVDDDQRVVRLLRFWNASIDPHAFEV